MGSLIWSDTSLALVNKGSPLIVKNWDQACQGYPIIWEMKLGGKLFSERSSNWQTCIDKVDECIKTSEGRKAPDASRIAGPPKDIMNWTYTGPQGGNLDYYSGQRR